MDGDRKLFLGPAALAKAYRFVADPRDGEPRQRLRRVDSQAGAWGCHQVQRCTLFCPKGVRPSDGIMAIRRSILALRFSRGARGK
jgi:succinate dehydrogenase / fumarate reductase iron-sulfur subunit